MSTPPGPVMIDIAGLTLSPEDKTLLLHPHVGGVILFARNYSDPAKLKQLVQSIHDIRPDLLVAVDQEGGRVQRFKEGFSPLPPLGALGQLYDDGQVEQAIAQTRQHAITMATELIAAGVSFSFAPVLDLNKAHNTVIGNRSFSRNPHTVTALGRVYIEALQAAGMPAVGKHFPGHGNTSTDSHHGIAQDTQSYEALCQSDLLPFKALLPSLDAIMPAHVIYTEVDSAPAGFSSLWLTTILRDQLGFKGVVFSDDLMMSGAAVGGLTPEARALLALQAGCDMVLVCNHREVARRVLDYLPSDVQSATSLHRLATLGLLHIDE